MKHIKVPAERPVKIQLPLLSFSGDFSSFGLSFKKPSISFPRLLKQIYVLVNLFACLLTRPAPTSGVGGL